MNQLLVNHSLNLLKLVIILLLNHHFIKLNLVLLCLLWVSSLLIHYVNALIQLFLNVHPHLRIEENRVVSVRQLAAFVTLEKTLLRLRRTGSVSLDSFVLVVEQVAVNAIVIVQIHRHWIASRLLVAAHKGHAVVLQLAQNDVPLRRLFVHIISLALSTVLLLLKVILLLFMLGHERSLWRLRSQLWNRSQGLSHS